MDTNERDEKFSTLNWGLLIASIITFLGVIVAMMLGTKLLVVLVCFVVHSVIDLLLIHNSISDKPDEDIFDQNDKPTVGWLEEKAKLENAKTEIMSQRDELEVKLRQKNSENTDLQNEIEKKNRELDEANSKLAAMDMLKENQESLAEEMNQAVEASLLPPTDGSVEVVNISEVAKRAVDELKSLAVKSEIEIKFNPTTEDLLVKANPERMRILFRNIIDNSIKYMGRSGQLVITISSIEDMVFIVLKDNGLGLPSEEVTHIFELNYQGSNRLSGNGLGLTQAKAIVDYYGGVIYAKSSAQGGMGIYIQLPASLS